ncbi:MAG: hypothetical protein U0457_15250 [Candidatus Sericytochromatia bacterium]
MSLTSFVKEIKIDRGVFSVKTSLGKFSASESYKEQMSLGNLPTEAPKDFKEAIPNLYYVPEGKDFIEYNVLHKKINDEKELILSSINNPSDEDKKKAQIESSKKVLKEHHINDKTLLIYSPILKQKFQEEDEYTKITATYNQEEKVIYVKTELIKKTNIYKNVIYQDELIPNIISNITEEPKKEERKVDLEALKNKYKFDRPKVKSISEIITGKKNTVEHHEEVIKEDSEENKLKNLITDSLGYIKGNWKNNTFLVNKKESGYLVPIEKIEIFKDEIIIKSSHFTNTEWWTKFTPISECPRYMGRLVIEDTYTPFCMKGKCSQACGVDDGFTELSAARFRLVEDREIIENGFKRLQEFLDRTYRLTSEFNETFGVEILIYLGSQNPYFFSKFPRTSDEFQIQNYISAFMTLYPEINDIRGNMDIEDFVIGDDFDPVDESGLVHEAKNYALQEMVRLASQEALEEVINARQGKIDGKFYLIDNGKMRYILRPTKIEAIRDELYMGNVGFKKGFNEVKQFISITLGGGRW